MDRLPIVNQRYELGAAAPPGGGEEDLRLGDVWSMLRRRVLLIALCGALGAAVAALYVARARPLFMAAATIRIEEKEPNLPEVFRTLASGNRVVTEMSVLASRALVGDVVDSLQLQFQVVAPMGEARSALFSAIRVRHDAEGGNYRLERQRDGSFALQDKTTNQKEGTLRPGDDLRARGFSFALSPNAARFPKIEFTVMSFEEAVAQTVGSLSIEQAQKSSNILTALYSDSDPDLVWRIPNVLSEHFIERRQDAQKTEARSTVKFLQHQLDTLSVQLTDAENSLQSFREREQVVSPAAEASSQVSRLIALQSERSTIEAERTGLAKSLEEVYRVDSTRGPSQPSAYRRLIGFPTLLRNQAASELLRSLTDIEDQRTALLARRTPEDPDVQALTSRVRELEDQLRSIAVTYLQGLSNQVASVDATLGQFQTQLSQVPRKDVEFSRFERKTKVLQDLVTMLQTRLKEAEIAQAVEDPSVWIVDRAAPPRHPVRPRPKLAYALGIGVGLLIGIVGALLIEYLDRSVHTRRDVYMATGLPVMGLIPRIAHRKGRFALIARQKKGAPARLSSGRVKRKSAYSFLPAPANGVSDRNGHGAGAQLPAWLSITGAGQAVAEAYGVLQTNIAFSHPELNVKTLVITSPLSGDGKTTCALNLALTLAERGLRTLLVDADLRRGGIAAAFDVPRQPGLSDVLLGSVPLSDAVRALNVGTSAVPLHFITAGKSSTAPAGLLETNRLKTLLDSVRDNYDRIIFDSPPVNIVADAALLSSAADAVLLIARSGVTDGTALGYALEQLRHVRATVLGVVLNDIDFRRDAVYDKTYRYYNQNEYITSTAEEA